MFLGNKSNNNTEISVFIKKLIIGIFFVVLMLFIYNILNILTILFFALFLNILFSPFLNYLNKYKIGDFVGMLIIYFVLILFIVIVFFTIVPIFIKQISILSENIQFWAIHIKTIYKERGISGFNLPSYITFLLYHLDINDILDSVKNNAGEISKFFATNIKGFISNGAGLLSTFTNAIFNFILVFIFSFFIALERKDIKDFFYRILPKSKSTYLKNKEPIIIQNLSNWLRGQLLLGISIFFLTFIGLFILRLFGVDIKEHFSLALVAGMMEFIPYIGPFLAIIPALAIAIGISSKAFIAVLILYIIIQQAENNILVPYIMSKTLSLSPFAVLLAMIIGASLFGIIGIILAIPIVSIIQIFLTDFLKKK